MNMLISIAVTAIDLDYGQNGYVTFESSNENFTVATTDGKHGVVHATRYVIFDKIRLKYQ